MMDYNLSKIARLEHEQRIRSVARVYDHDERAKDDRQLTLYPIHGGYVGDNADQPGWLAIQLGRLFTAVGNALSGLGARLSQDQNRGMEPSFKDR